MRHWIKDAEDCLDSQYARVCKTLDSNTAPQPLAFAPALEENEARNFILGMENELFRIDEHGYVQSSLLPLPSGRNTRQKMLQLFWAKKNGRGLFREGVCQLATASSLVLEHGWSKDQVIMEPGIAEFGELAYGVDILIRDQKNKISICGEVKKSATEFQKLIDGFQYCCMRGAHTKGECLFAPNHPKYEFCIAIKPSYLFVTAPAKKSCFKLTYSDDIHIEEVTYELPKREWFH